MKRLEGIRNQFTVEKIDALIVESDANRRYLSGFTGSAGVILITSDQAYFITDFRYVEQAKNQCEGYTIVEHKGQSVTSSKHLKSTALLLVLKNLIRLLKNMKCTRMQAYRLIPVAGLVESLRMFKDEKELSIMKEAAEIADQTFYDIVDYIKPGMKETEVRDRLEFTMRRLGADRSSFDIIVASGSRGALPHGVASDKVIEEGELVTMDFGAYYKGYCSDITRTVAVGQPTDEMKKVYETVLEAQLLGVEQIKPGMTGKEADQICRDYIYSKGYEGKFGHGLGHGLGMEVHEGPGVSPKGNVVLKPGMVVTVEPGVYLPGVGGVRIEDDIVITADGNERLTTSDKSLRHIGK
ncbi:LOW QUALITY PROTEIN: aminopeptidase YpdF [Geomicrobium sp. JCM 19037]|nr:LOW QUALITY PROTEIN: aminopeptidase YpdF [Geomicrobium sp. JCM 19037]